MLRDDAFLRRLPVAILLEERFHMDALVMSADLAEYAYLKLRSALSHYDFNRPVLKSRTDLVEIAHFAWALVDQIHNFRTTGRMLKEQPITSLHRLLENSKNVTLMRNNMDHLSSNAGNRSKRKKEGHLTYGSISFLAPSSEDELIFVMINFGSIQQPSVVGPVFDTHMLPGSEISAVSLTAFDRQINFDALMVDLNEAVTEIDAWYHRAIEKILGEKAASNGIAVDDLMRQRAPEIPHMKLIVRRPLSANGEA